MQIMIDIPDEQINKSLEESKYINEDEGEKGFVNIAMLYTNAQLEFVDVERKTDFYSCEYKILPKGHGRLIDADAFERRCMFDSNIEDMQDVIYALRDYKPIIEADKESDDKKKLSWLGKNCKDCGNGKCKELGTLPKGYDCALWKAESEDKE